MAAPLITVAAFKVWPGVVVDVGQDPSAEAVIAAASDFVRSESPGVAAWPDPATAPDSIKSVVTQVAARVWRNPSCAVAITTGPFSEQFDRAVADGLYLTAADASMIRKASGRRGLWTQQTRRDRPGDPVGYDPFSGVIVPPAPYPLPQFLFEPPK